MDSGKHCLCAIALCVCFMQIGICGRESVLTRLKEFDCASPNNTLELVEMKSCNRSGDTIECEYIGLAVDYAPFISYDFSLYAILWFDVLPDGRCLSLKKISAKKVSNAEVNYNISCSPLNPQWLLFMLLGLKSFSWGVELNGRTPVGLLEHGTQVMVLNPTELLGKGQNGYSPEYHARLWSLLVEDLGSHNGFLDVGLYMQTNGTSYMQVYIMPLIDSSPNLTSLRVAGHMDWGNVPPLISYNLQLYRLELPDNNITSIDIENFKNASEITYLNLADNKLSSIPVGVSLLSKLKTLDLSGNPIQYSSHHGFSFVMKVLVQLKHLFLARTKLMEMGQLFSTLASPSESENSTLLLRTLDVSQCFITSLNDSFTSRILTQQSLLRSINFAGNKLNSSIPSNLFINLPHLKVLNLSDTELSEGPALEIHGGGTLSFLDLSRNKLTQPKNILRSGSVKHLSLSGNMIKQWKDPDAFYCERNVSSWVKELNISLNVLPSVTNAMGRSLRCLQLVDLGGNPFDCRDCLLPEFQAWLAKMSASKIKNLGRSTDITCEEPYAMMGSPVREVSSEDLLAWCKTTSNHTTVIAVTCSLLLILLISGALVVYYRHEVAYLSYLVKLKKRRRNICGEGKFEYDAFVCYSRADRNWVIEEMLPTLENCPDKFRLCLHERDFILGSFITLNIVNSMQKSRFTIVVLSNSFVKSQWCRWEIEMANHKLFESGREFLILVELERLDEKQIPRHLRYLMDTRTYLEWPKSKTEAAPAWKRLRSALGTSLHRMEQRTLEDQQRISGV